MHRRAGSAYRAYRGGSRNPAGMGRRRVAIRRLIRPAPGGYRRGSGRIPPRATGPSTRDRSTITMRAIDPQRPFPEPHPATDPEPTPPLPTPPPEPRPREPQPPVPDPTPGPQPPVPGPSPEPQPPVPGPSPEPVPPAPGPVPGPAPDRPPLPDPGHPVPPPPFPAGRIGQDRSHTGDSTAAERVFDATSLVAGSTGRT